MIILYRDKLYDMFGICKQNTLLFNYDYIIRITIYTYNWF